ncbi:MULTISPECIES: helix-turn-helix domain-containing protein [Cytobacillus]|uniref:helix-turn-helix domain-containing protein n=1 Tax=Cytobacillus TaxID=2675230 RepID=UPI001CD759A8|nr:Rgg/GadR/MutR family transcriptional regulator [Cytobacillus kochii]MCA1024627.1 helix-turn-helix domain-containing protein [Cytobacillus kochii]MCM3323379.1 helix-turn-helix domain-containing protein [Cytobacillus kochii]MCM3345774.1 helix-turn-helix domain-containing protein [Cytobacillus kochii]
MNKIGHVFRTIRLAKNLSLKDIAQGDISVSFLSKFERDESDISLSKFYSLLNKMNITLEEFRFIANDYKLMEHEVMLDNVRSAYESNNIILLETLKKKELAKYSETKRNTYKLNSIMISALVCDLRNQYDISAEDKTYLSDYLLSVETWGYYENILFGNSLSILTLDSVILFSKEILKRSKLYMNLNVNRDEVVGILLNATVFCIEGNRISESLYFIKIVDEMLENKVLYFEKTKLLFLKGLYDIKTQKKEKGIEKCKSAIQIMHDLGSILLAVNHEEYLEKFLEH